MTNIASQNEKVTNTFLEEGIRSYFHAANALAVFEQEVQSICRRVLESHLKDYNDALRVKPLLTAGEIQAAKYTGDSFEFRTLGAEIKRERPVSVVSYWAILPCVYWLAGEEHATCWIGEAIWPRKAGREVYERFRDLNERVYLEDSSEIGLCRHFQAQEAESIESCLSDVFSDWIQLWSKVGGMGKIFKK